MKDLLKPIILLSLMLIMIGVFIYYMIEDRAACHAIGGAWVRGFMWMECIK